MTQPDDQQANQQDSRRTPKPHRAQAWQTETWTRGKISGAAYNPRYIDPSSRRRLREGIQDFGLLGPITVNRRSGNIVGGHQRLDALDQLDNSGGNYTLEVAVVDLDPEQEKEANIFLNNPNNQGQFDFSKLQQMYEEGTNPFKAGMEILDLEMDYGEEFARAMQRKYLEQQALDDVEQQHVDEGFQTSPDHEAKVEADIALIKQRKAEYLEKARTANRPDYNLIIVFPAAEELEEWLEGLGYDTTLRALPADDFQRVLEDLAPDTAVFNELDAQGFALEPLVPHLTELAGEEFNAENVSPLLGALIRNAVLAMPPEVVQASRDEHARALAEAEQAAEDGDDVDEEAPDDDGPDEEEAAS